VFSAKTNWNAIYVVQEHNFLKFAINPTSAYPSFHQPPWIGGFFLQLTNHNHFRKGRYPPKI